MFVKEAHRHELHGNRMNGSFKPVGNLSQRYSAIKALCQQNDFQGCPFLPMSQQFPFRLVFLHNFLMPLGVIKAEIERLAFISDDPDAALGLYRVQQQFDNFRFAISDANEISAV
jgi:hypothetical protein